MDGPTISQPCIDFEPDERWHIKEETSSKQEASLTATSSPAGTLEKDGNEGSSKNLTEAGNKSMYSKSLDAEVNGSAFECQEVEEGSQPRVNGEVDEQHEDTAPSHKSDKPSSVGETSEDQHKMPQDCSSNKVTEDEKMEVDSDTPRKEKLSSKSEEELSKAALDDALATLDSAQKALEAARKTPEPSEARTSSDKSEKAESIKESSKVEPSPGISQSSAKPELSLSIENKSSESETKSKQSSGRSNKSVKEDESLPLVLESGFPPSFNSALIMGGYRPAHDIQKELKLDDEEALLETPSFVVPLLIKKPNIIAKPVAQPQDEDEKKEAKVEESKDKEKGYFGKSVGKFLIGLGLSRASECYQRDMTRVKLWQLKKEGKSDFLEEELQMHKNAYNQARIANEPFKFKSKKCEFCDFQTESQLVMDLHYSIPHLNFRKEYKCNYCTYMSRDPKSILFHFEAMHGRRAILDLPVQFYQCPFCSFETHLKTKASSHINKCQKFFAPGRNQLPPADYPYPALTAKPLTIQEIKVFEMATAKAAQAQSRSQFVAKRGRRPNQMNMVGPMSHGGKYMSNRTTSLPLYHQLASQALTNNMEYNSSLIHKSKNSSSGNPASTSLHFPPGLIITKSNKPIAPVEQNKQYSGRGSVSNSSLPLKRPLPSSTSLSYVNSDGNKGSKMQGSLYSNLAAGGLEITPTSASSNSNKPIITIQPTGGSSAKGGNPPLPKLQGPFIPGQRIPQSKHASLQGNSYVICEICDAYIKDLEQLRTHMQSSHKIKIHPKMLANRPPLNCQKCHWRFFTDQGLERHLLGAHGLVTSNMQEMANKNQDGGRCTICGGIFACKLVAHMNRVHKVTLKPAHLSYKCTVCSTTFTLYRLFENHVYTVHSGGNKRSAPDDSSGAPPAKKRNVPQSHKASSKSTSSSITSTASSAAATGDGSSSTIKLGNSISITVIKKDGEGGGEESTNKPPEETTKSAGEETQMGGKEEEEEEEQEDKTPVVKRCKDCGKDTEDLLDHLKDQHLKKLKVKVCHIEKCEKCLSHFDGMVVLHTSDFGIEEEDEEEEEEDITEESTAAVSNKDEAPMEMK